MQIHGYGGGHESRKQTAHVILECHHDRPIFLLPTSSFACLSAHFLHTPYRTDPPQCVRMLLLWQRSLSQCRSPKFGQLRARSFGISIRISFLCLCCDNGRKQGWLITATTVDDDDRQTDAKDDETLSDVAQEVPECIGRLLFEWNILLFHDIQMWQSYMEISVSSGSALNIFQNSPTHVFLSISLVTTAHHPISPRSCHWPSLMNANSTPRDSTRFLTYWSRS